MKFYFYKSVGHIPVLFLCRLKIGSFILPDLLPKKTKIRSVGMSTKFLNALFKLGSTFFCVQTWLYVTKKNDKINCSRYIPFVELFPWQGNVTLRYIYFYYYFEAEFTFTKKNRSWMLYEIMILLRWSI